ncbi:glutaredoxin 2 [Oceanobacter mangrovi]|uniref:glutaredoxin 2 n=1 Tax=Oceanobacter mangrovi TaxID=2862510 RepID=UPI001C8D1BB3|nr:glutaredoxin 2 [Oceanobacter mangrovi]
MKLYQYNHCPYCVRADMVANYKQLEHEKVFLLNDDEQSCFDLIGAKMVPILEFDDGTAMGESLDICQRLDQLGNPQQVILPYQQAQLEAAQALISASMMDIHHLLFPRNIMLGLPEFVTQDACDYYRRKKELIIGKSFEAAIANSAEYQQRVEAMLQQLPELTRPSENNGQIGWNDVMLFPTLRNLSMVAGLSYPAAIRTYLEEVSAATGLACLFDFAI